MNHEYMCSCLLTCLRVCAYEGSRQGGMRVAGVGTFLQFRCVLFRVFEALIPLENDLGGKVSLGGKRLPPGKCENHSKGVEGIVFCRSLMVLF